jgi:hypothetical protein
MKEKTVSGAIKWTDDRSSYNRDGDYTIRNKIGQGWGIPTKDITPDDLRAMADHLEKVRRSMPWPSDDNR